MEYEAEPSILPDAGVTVIAFVPADPTLSLIRKVSPVSGEAGKLIVLALAVSTMITSSDLRTV